MLESLVVTTLTYSSRKKRRLDIIMRRAPFHVTGPDGSFIIRELLTEDALERKRVADVIGDAFEYDAWFKKDGEPRRLAGGAKEVHVLRIQEFCNLRTSGVGTKDYEHSGWHHQASH